MMNGMESAAAPPASTARRLNALPMSLDVMPTSLVAVVMPFS
jgi:hypothetical protein